MLVLSAPRNHRVPGTRMNVFLLFGTWGGVSLSATEYLGLDLVGLLGLFSRYGGGRAGCNMLNRLLVIGEWC